MDVLDIATNRLAIVVPVAAQSILSLRNIVVRYESHDRSLARLYNVLEDLYNDLRALEQTTIPEASTRTILEGPTRRCNLLCQDFERAMQEFAMKPTTGLRDWSEIELTAGDIYEFIDILTGYQATISVGLDTVNNYKQTVKTPHKSLKGVKNKVQAAVYTLNMNLQRVDDKMNHNSRESQNTIASARNIELEEERAMINQCLRVCQVVGSRIQLLASLGPPLEDKHLWTSLPGFQNLFNVEITAKSKPSAVSSHKSPASSGSANPAQPTTVLSLEASADGTYEVVNTLASRRVTPEDFEDACECCVFWLFSPENFSSIERQACSSLKEEVSHIVTHSIDHHGLIRGKDPRNPSRKYLASCQTTNPLIDAKGVCEKCSSIYKWNEEDFMNSAHYGIVLCLRCWYTFNKREMQDHLAEPLCAYNAGKPKREKVYSLYTTFCSETRPPSTPPWPSIPSSDQQPLPSPAESSSSLGLPTPGELLEPLISLNLDKPTDTTPTLASGGDSTTISLAPDDIFTSGEVPTSSNHLVATTDTSIRHTEESVEFEADKVNGTDDSEEEPDKSVEHMNDVASIQSFDDDIQSSSSSYTRTPHVIVAERQIGALLAGHPGVNFVLEESIGVMPRDRLKRNIRRSLKLLYLRLREETQSNVQVLATQMFKGRNSRRRISRQTVEKGMVGLVTSPGSEEDAEKPTFRKDRAFLDSWLSSLQCTEQIDEKPQDLRSLKETHDESDSSTDSGSNISEQYQAVQVAEDFLIRGTAFRAFLTELTLSLLPVHLRQIMQLASWGDTELIDQAFRISTSDRIKSSVENITGSPWNWWPMASPKIPLRRGHVRMNWKCHCGKPSWVDITPSQARIIERVINNPASFVENKESTHSRQSVVHSIASWFGRRSVALLPTSTPASQNNHLPSSGIGSSDQAQGTTAIAGEGNKLPSAACDLRILFGVPTGPKTLHLTPILVTQQPKSEVFPQMQKEHRRIRGRIRAWLSFWQLSHCNFVKFESIASNVVVACGQGLPEANDIDYDFSPKPASLPPIHPHVFEAAFNSCAGGSCRRLFPPHECYEFEETIYIPRIPKKKTPISSGERHVAIWGLEARYCISCFHVILYHVLILIPPFALWGAWMTKHPGDIQSASVPMTVVVAMISMFWSATGILKQFRGEL